MMKNYTIVTKTLVIDSERYTTYGIKCGNDTINNISCDIDFVSKIVKALNDYDVSNVHFRDVVEDFISNN